MRLIIVAILSVFAVTAHSEEKTSEDFSGEKVPDGWKGVKGAWAVSDGAMSGKELAADEHGAVFMIPDRHRDSTFSCRFQVNGAKAFGLSYNHPKGHLFRVRINAKNAILSLDKDKKDPTSKPLRFGNAKLNLKPGKWYFLTCNVKGDTVEVECAGEVLIGKHDKLTMEKTGYRFTVAGESVLIDDVNFSSDE